MIVPASAWCMNSDVLFVAVFYFQQSGTLSFSCIAELKLRGSIW